MAEARKELAFMANLAEKAGRYDEMVEFMEKVVALLPEAEEPTVRERILLSLAYKNVINSRRSSWKIVSSVCKRMERSGEGDLVTAVRDYRAKLESELSSVCEGILRLLDTRLLPSATADEARVLFLKMKGECHFFLSQLKTGAPQDDAVRRSFSAYEAAQVVAEEKLAPTNATRLGLALHLSEFYFEFLKWPLTACALAEQAFDEALALLRGGCRGLPLAKEAVFLMMVLHERVSSWRRDM